MFKHLRICAIGPILFGIGLSNIAVAAECTTIKGKIFNSLVVDGTLGTAHVNYDGSKFKCGLHGRSRDKEPGDDTLNFYHDMVCDDDVGGDAFGRPIHSKLVWKTTGHFLDDNGEPWGGIDGIPGTDTIPPCLIFNTPSSDFEETSTPVAGTGGGEFAGVTADAGITITGTFYCGTEAIDMTFSGTLCQ